MDSPSFGSVIKAWFKRNDWPQSVPEALAKAKGNKTGPWASQISHAMNDKHQPKTDFFLALAWFNQCVVERDVAGLTDRRLIERIRNAQPMCHDNGTPYDAADFFRLFTGLLDPPKEFAANEPPEFTQDDLDQWHVEIRAMFKEIALEQMCTKKEAWDMVKANVLKILEEEGVKAGDFDDMKNVQAVICGFADASMEQFHRVAYRWRDSQPFLRAMEALLETPGKFQARALIEKAQAILPKQAMPVPIVRPRVDPGDQMGFRVKLSDIFVNTQA